MDVENILINPNYASLEHVNREMLEFTICRRKIRKWLSEKNPERILEITNHFVGISNVFKRDFIIETIKTKYTEPERRIINTIIGIKPIDSEFKREWAALV